MLIINTVLAINLLAGKASWEVGLGVVKPADGLLLCNGVCVSSSCLLNEVDSPLLQVNSSLLRCLSVCYPLLPLRAGQVSLDGCLESRMGHLHAVEKRRIWRQEFEMNSRAGIIR